MEQAEKTSGASSRPAVEVDRLNLSYGDFPAVKELTFQVQHGELYALLGTNGAGKTSALEVIEGHRKASSGTVRVFGESPTDRRAVRPRMGIMLQESGFSADLTAAESVRLVGRLSGRSDSVDRVLGIVELTHKAATRVGQLSGGEKRRLDFATAVYGRPELIILDEPTTGLDIQSRDALWAAVGELRGNGSTVILTTHYLEEAQQHADRIGLMHRGTLRSQGTVPELTQTLPAAIQFSLSPDAPVPPLGTAQPAGMAYQIETFELQADLKRLLDWADLHDVDLHGLSAAPTRLDDVFRAIETDPVPTPTR
jgi:ABC-2 type transport system ATP-binding protein